MSQTSPTCPKCELAMDKGFMMDRDAHGSSLQAHWGKGEPVKSIVGRQPSSGLSYRVFTYKCPQCGLLESYAVDGFD